MEHKRVILNRCLTFCDLKWKCLKGPRRQILDFNTFAQRVKELFIVFDRQKIQDDYKTNFNSNSESHGVVLNMWANQKKEEPSFGTFANWDEMDEEAEKNCVSVQKRILLIHFKI